jgi:hypothetical protein
LIDPGTIGTKNGILVHQGAQYGADVGRINGLQPKVSRLSAAITHHQHRNVLPRSSHTASFACGPGQLALPLEGLQEEGLIGLDNPALVRGAVRGCGFEKTMAPEKRGVFIHCAASGGLTHAHTLHQCLRIAQPLLTFSQVRQGRAGERIAGLAAGVAAHARQSMAVAPRAQLLGWGLAVGAGLGTGQDAGNCTAGCIGQRSQDALQLCPLLWTQGCQLAEKSDKVASVHVAPPLLLKSD